MMLQCFYVSGNRILCIYGSLNLTFHDFVDAWLWIEPQIDRGAHTAVFKENTEERNMVAQVVGKLS